MKIKIRYKKNKHQKEFADDLQSPFLHMSTGFGGGKTYALCMKSIQLRWLNRPYSGGIVAPSFPDLKRDVIEVMDDILTKNNIQHRYHKTDHYYSFPWTPGKIFLFSGEKKIRGPNLADMGLNEATLMSRETYMEAVGRVRVKGSKHPQIYSVGTPEGVGNYMYELFVDKPMPGSKIIYGDTRDNLENLNDGYIPAMEASFDKITLDAYLRGLWVNMNGNQFYFAYEKGRNEDRGIVENLGRGFPLDICCFMDFNVQHMTATFWHHHLGQLLGFDEIVIENNADTKKMIRAMNERGYTPDRTTVFPDPAGKARKTNGAPDHEILEEAGFEVEAKLSAPRMRERQLNTNNLLEKGLIKFNPDKMPTFRRDMQAVAQDPATFEKLKDNPKLTHASDGFDYGCDILFPFSGKRVKSEIVTFR